MAALVRIALILLLGLTAPALMAELPSQKEAVSAFYATVLAFQEPGIPSHADTGKLKGLASRNLRTLLGQARKAEDLYGRRTKGEVPPLVESRLFFSLFEGAHRLDTVTPEPGGTFLAGLSHGEGTNATNWSDRVFLKRERGRWVVDDIEFLGTWAFGDKGRVQDLLRDVIRTAAETPAP